MLGPGLTEHPQCCELDWMKHSQCWGLVGPFPVTPSQSGREVLVRAAGLVSEQGPGSGSVSPRGREAGLLPQSSPTHLLSTLWAWGHAGSQHPCAFHAWHMTVALEEHGSSLPMTGKSVWERFWWKSLGQHRLPAQHCRHMAHMGVSLAVPWQLLPSPRAESGGPGCSQAGWLQSGQAGTGERASKGSLALTFL